MQCRLHQLSAALLLLCVINTSATVLYVNLNCPTPTSPYATWAAAATNIQDAIDSANTGDLILVTNGVYETGGRVVNGYALTNRVAVTKGVIVQSVNGSAATSIRGYQIPGATNGDGAVRCAYLTNGATLAGFTLINGATRVSGDVSHECSGGGAWCESVSAVIFDCALRDNAAYTAGGGVCNAWAINCTLNNNFAYSGGGAYQGTLISCKLNSNSAVYGGGAADTMLINCTLSTNSAVNAGDHSSGYGGGASGGTLNNCTLTGNSAFFRGGGAFSGTLNGCTLTGNSAYQGGGANSSTLTNCALIQNSASEGGGAWYGRLDNCILTGNSAQYPPWIYDGVGGGAYVTTLNNCTLTRNSASLGGGAHSSTLNNCTLANNSAVLYGGGAYSSLLNNCIIYFNTVSGYLWYPFGGANHYFCTLNYCCSTCDDGCASLMSDPVFMNPTVDDFRLQSNSPCINSGNNAYITATNDLNGSPRIKGGTVDIGAYEYQTPVSTIPYAWLYQYGLSINTNTDSADADGDGMKNRQEWIAGTDPTNPLSVLKLLPSAQTNMPPGRMLTWQSVSGITYFLQRSTNLLLHPSFSSIQSNILGQAGTTSFADTNANGAEPYFYRVGVQ
jgi:hypothetical protein